MSGLRVPIQPWRDVDPDDPRVVAGVAKLWDRYQGRAGYDPARGMDALLDVAPADISLVIDHYLEPVAGPGAAIGGRIVYEWWLEARLEQAVER